MKKLRPNSP